MNKLDAYKMDGLGNDFIIFDKREKSISLTKDQIIKISDRNNIGCDQVILINKDKDSDAFLKFYNSDGGEISACGNGSRCVAYLLMKEGNKNKISLRTKAGTLQAELNEKNLVSINMGQPIFEWDKIPLSKKMDNKNLEIKINYNNGKEIVGGFSLNVGNPHIIFFVNDFNKFDLKVKVWERGAGLTKACGTAACATAVSSSVLKLSERCVDIEFLEGSLNIDWKEDNNVYMTGKVSEAKKIMINI